MNRNQRQSGLTLIEVSMSIGLALTVIGLAMTYFKFAEGTSKTMEVQSQLATIQTAVQQLYPGRKYTGLTPAVLIQSTKLPTRMISGATIINTYGGTVEIWPTAFLGVDRDFAIRMREVPNSACVELIMQNKDTYEYMNVNDAATAVQWIYGGAKATSATAAAACSTANGKGYIDFVKVN